MKRTLFAVCIGTLALAMGAAGQDNHNNATEGRGKGRAAAKATSQASTAGGARRGAQVTTRQHGTGQRFHQGGNFDAQSATSARFSSSNRRLNRSDTVRTRSVRADERARTGVAVQNNAPQFRRNRSVQQERTFNRAGEQNFAVNRERNFNRTRNVTVVNNWRGQRFNGQNYAAFRNYHREWHDRGWWTSHYPRITFYFGAPYYWNAGYWYPAWGYYPGYTYEYDGPIYGYSGLAPDQVTVNVQVQLQREGYYSGPIDGILGPQTREAIAEFQADHGLAVTSAIDEPTLSTLGLV
jgi:hypothetical protein